jgi:hypothetical protein
MFPRERQGKGVPSGRAEIDRDHRYLWKKNISTENLKTADRGGRG